jgi:hypothetical protein
MDEQSTPEKAPNMVDLGITSPPVYLEGDKNGNLAVHASSVVDDMVSAYEHFWSEHGIPKSVEAMETFRREVERLAPWLVANNGKVPNSWQNESNIVQLFRSKSPITNVQQEALSTHPNPLITDLLVSERILSPREFANILIVGGIEPNDDRAHLMYSRQKELLQKSGRQDSRFISTTLRGLRKVLDGEYQKPE